MKKSTVEKFERLLKMRVKEQESNISEFKLSASDGNFWGHCCYGNILADMEKDLENSKFCDYEMNIKTFVSLVYQLGKDNNPPAYERLTKALPYIVIVEALNDGCIFAKTNEEKRNKDEYIAMLEAANAELGKELENYELE
jgi:hypothetical protein